MEDIELDLGLAKDIVAICMLFTLVGCGAICICRKKNKDAGILLFLSLGYDAADVNDDEVDVAVPEDNQIGVD